jgi:hypothetical protein
LSTVSRPTVSRSIVSRPAVSRPPGHGLLHPVPLAAIGLLLLNDHVLKARWPGWVTGKLSDAAGLVFFPLLLDALLAWLAAWLAPERRLAAWLAPERRLAGSVIATALVFAAVKTWAPATAAYEIGLGLLQWPFGVAGALLRGEAPGGPRWVTLVRDPTDLVALPFAATALLLGRRRPAT